MNNEADVNIISCDHMQGTSKTTQKPYDFYTGEAVLFGGVVKYTSTKPFKADVTKYVRAFVTLKPDQQKNLKVQLEPKL